VERQVPASLVVPSCGFHRKPSSLTEFAAAVTTQINLFVDAKLSFLACPSFFWLEERKESEWIIKAGLSNFADAQGLSGADR
jgi:hypothetical protein